jgi:hypothetical protein
VLIVAAWRERDELRHAFANQTIATVVWAKETTPGLAYQNHPDHGPSASVAAACLIACAMIASGSAQQRSNQPSQPQSPARDTSARPSTPATAPAATGRMTGRVVAADTGRPIKRARVFISAAELPGGRGILTDDSGAFDFTGLPAGRYTINASKSGYIQLSYGQRRPLQAGHAAATPCGQQLKASTPRRGAASSRAASR